MESYTKTNGAEVCIIGMRVWLRKTKTGMGPLYNDGSYAWDTQMCKYCFRVHLFRSDRRNEYRTYRLISGEINHVLWSQFKVLDIFETNPKYWKWLLHVHNYCFWNPYFVQLPRADTTRGLFSLWLLVCWWYVLFRQVSVCFRPGSNPLKKCSFFCSHHTDLSCWYLYGYDWKGHQFIPELR